MASERFCPVWRCHYGRMLKSFFHTFKSLFAFRIPLVHSTIFSGEVCERGCDWRKLLSKPLEELYQTQKATHFRYVDGLDHSFTIDRLSSPNCTPARPIWSPINSGYFATSSRFYIPTYSLWSWSLVITTRRCFRFSSRVSLKSKISSRYTTMKSSMQS